MFDFLFQKKNKEMQSMAEVIALDLEKLNLSKLAIEKAVMMIARAIAKSDIIVQTDSTQKSSIEYRLNEKLIMLRDMMRKKGLHPTILHEFITDDKIWHSYFSLETMNE